jgi:hypothetical protein
MNKLQQDEFIFNYLEGNLNNSQKELFEEILTTDYSFKADFELWKKTYELKNTSKDKFSNKAILEPKRALYKYYFVSSLIALTALSYLAFKNFENKNTTSIQYKTKLIYSNNSITPPMEHKNLISPIIKEKPTAIHSKNKNTAELSSKDSTQDLQLNFIKTPTLLSITPKIQNNDSINIENKEIISLTPTINKDTSTLTKIQKEKEVKKNKNSFKKQLNKVKYSFKNQVVIPAE